MEPMRTRLRSQRAAVILGVGLLLSACSTSAPNVPLVPTGPPGVAAPSTTAPAASDGPLVAYRSATEIGVVDGTEKVASAKGTFAPSADPLVTEDGKYVFAMGRDGLVVLDVATKKSRTVAVPAATPLGTGGAATVVWWEQPNRLMTADLAAQDARPMLRQLVELPAVAEAGPAALLTARGGTAILARPEGTSQAGGQPGGGPETLYAVRGNGPPAPLGQADAPVGAAVLSPDGSSLAYALYRATSDVCGDAAVVFSDAAGAQQTYDVAPAASAISSRVLRLWWQQGQPMSLSLATWQCDPPSSYSPLVWQLAGAGLVSADPRTVALQSEQVVPGQRALIVPQGGPAPGPGGEATGTLVVEDSGRRLPVQAGVDAIDVIAAP